MDLFRPGQFVCQRGYWTFVKETPEERVQRYRELRKRYTPKALRHHMQHERFFQTLDWLLFVRNLDITLKDWGYQEQDIEVPELFDFLGLARCAQAVLHLETQISDGDQSDYYLLRENLTQVKGTPDRRPQGAPHWALWSWDLRCWVFVDEGEWDKDKERGMARGEIPLARCAYLKQEAHYILKAMEDCAGAVNLWAEWNLSVNGDVIVSDSVSGEGNSLYDFLWESMTEQRITQEDVLPCLPGLVQMVCLAKERTDEDRVVE